MIESVHRNGRTVSEFAEDIVDRETAFLVFRHPCIGGCEGGSRQRPPTLQFTKYKKRCIFSVQCYGVGSNANK